MTLRPRICISPWQPWHHTGLVWAPTHTFSPPFFRPVIFFNQFTAHTCELWIDWRERGMDLVAHSTPCWISIGPLKLSFFVSKTWRGRTLFWGSWTGRDRSNYSVLCLETSLCIININAGHKSSLCCTGLWHRTCWIGHFCKCQKARFRRAGGQGDFMATEWWLMFSKVIVTEPIRQIKYGTFAIHIYHIFARWFGFQMEIGLVLAYRVTLG